MLFEAHIQSTSGEPIRALGGGVQRLFSERLDDDRRYLLQFVTCSCDVAVSHSMNRANPFAT
jgi:hypothetical protein